MPFLKEKAKKGPSVSGNNLLNNGRIIMGGIGIKSTNPAIIGNSLSSGISKTFQ